ncbi:tape measure protein, partial [Heliobacillus mobilis]
SAKSLLAMGISAEQVIPDIQAVGNAVAAVGGGEEALKGVSMALGQINTSGKLNAQDMMQLTSRGIAAWDILANKMGISTEELRKQSEQGKIMASQVLPLLIQGMGEKYAGATDKLGKSFTGMTSTLKDFISSTLGELT